MRGDGVYKRPGSPYWYFKLKNDGKWREISTKTANYQKAKKVRLKATQDQQAGVLPEGEVARWPFEQAACQYIQKASMRLRPTSLRKERSFLVRPQRMFGNIPCQQVTATHIHRLQAGMKNDACKNTYNNLVLGATVRVLKFAKVWLRLREDVARLSERDNKPVARVLKPAEKTRLFQVAGSNPNWVVAYAAGLITANTTARGADLKCLRWIDVDLFEKLMDIPDSKSDAGKRRLPLNPDAMLGFRILLERANQFGVSGPQFYVFPACEHLQIDGTRPQKTWRTAWRSLTWAAGLKGLRFHDLRHQCITELLEGGAPEAAVLSIAGHVSRKMMEHYSHIRMDAKRKALEGLTSVTAVDRPVNDGDLRVN